jgi:integrase
VRTKKRIPSDSLSEHRALESGTFVFHADLPISTRSRFGDGKWDWRDKGLRLKVLSKGKLLIDWDQFTIGKTAAASLRMCNRLFIPQLPKEMIEDLKRAFFIIACFPSLLRGNRKRSMKPISIVGVIRVCVNFLSYLYLENLLPNKLVRIKTLADISAADLQRSINTYRYDISSLKSVLMLLASEVVQINLVYGRLQFNRIDVRTLHWPPKKECENIPTLPDRLFALLSNSSANLISEFHRLLGNETRDAKTETSDLGNNSIRWPRFKEMYESYVTRREIKRIKGPGWVSSHTKPFVQEFGVQPKAVLEFLFDVQSAAFQIVLLYTGMRYSEAASIRTGCLTMRDGVTIIKSTLIKNEPSNLPVDHDEWVAIGIVQDAMRALEELSRCTFNEFLFANFETIRVDQDENPISNAGLNERLNYYLRKIDEQGTWTDWQLSPHQYRHGLIYQLARAEVGIPYITRQLKHYHSLLSERTYKINPTSTIYGVQRQQLVANATGLRALRSANVEAAIDLYGEGRRFAGGGAALHVERTEAFFKGIGLEGKAREKYIEKLSESGGTEIRTGVGVCLRNHVDPEKLREAPPPCIGDLNCNPHSCVHSVVPEGRKADVIGRYRNAVKQLRSSEQRHLKSHWKAELLAYSAMLQQLGVDPQGLTEAGINPRTIERVLAPDRG